MKYIIWIFVIQSILIKSYECAMPTYQVSIQIQDSEINNEFTYCTGVILQKRLILTAATCVISAQTSSILIVRETPTALGETYENAVKEIIVHPAYKATTLEHDVAILRLSTSMPFGLAEGFEWIVLGSDDARNKFCLVNLNEENSSLGRSDIIKWKFGQPSQCLSGNNATNEQCKDFNLLSFNCGDNKALTRVNVARGAGVVCDSKLYALVTRLYPIMDTNTLECRYTKANVHFTILSLYVEWIYDYIIEEEGNDINDGTYVASKPYQESMSAHIVELTEATNVLSTETTPTTTIATAAATTPDITTTTPEVTVTVTVSTTPIRLEQSLPSQASAANKRDITTTTIPESTTTIKITTPDSEYFTRNNANFKQISLLLLLFNIICVLHTSL